MKALVLSGGGAHGAYEAGVAKALLERESYDLLCGVSIGAINAALIGAGTPDALERLWYGVLPSRSPELFPHVARLRRVMERLEAICQGSPWRKAVQLAYAAGELPFLRNLGNVHRSTLRAVVAALSELVDYSRLHTPLLIGATNVGDASPAVFRAFAGGAPNAPAHREHGVEYHDLDAGNFVMALLASSAMPGLFSPIELTFDGKTSPYADGCIVHTSPLGVAIDNGADDVTVVFVDPEPDRKASEASLGIAQMAYTIGTLWQQRMLDFELRLAEATNEIIRLGGAPGKRQITIRTVRPAEALELDMLGFADAPALARTFELGYADGSLAPRVALPGVETEPAAARTPVQTAIDFVRRLTRSPRTTPAGEV